MSILAASAAPDAPLEPNAATVIFALMLVALPLAIALPTGLFRPDRLTLPDRLREQRAWPLLLSVAAGMLALFIVSNAYGVVRMLQARQVLGVTRPGEAEAWQPTPVDYAFFATVPPVVFIVVVLSGDLLVSRDMLRRLGLGLRRLGGGLMWGLIGILLVFPIIYGVSVLCVLFYQWVGYDHPEKHDLLRLLDETDQPLVRAGLILGATIIAPLWEEIFFRGHVQTLIRRFCLRYVAREPLGVEEFSGPLPAWPSWMAILVTGVGFALVHPFWTVPMILVLAICMGYAYERTGNLWVPIVMHAVFNTTNTALSLLAGPQN